MSETGCGYCGGTLTLVRAGSKFCSTKCRVYAARKANSLPEVMASSRRFVRFNAKKVPFTVAGTAASSTDPSTWATHREAKASSVGAGIGYVLGAGVGCIDLDHCISDGIVAEWAQEVLDANPDTFTEVSMSGDGIHIFGLLDEAPGRKIRDGVRNIEFYSVGRYIALTGSRFGGSPSKLAPLVVPSM